VVILGENDLQNDEVTLKDMDSGDETKVDKDKIVEVLVENT
jgi:Anticodon binding domain.